MRPFQMSSGVSGQRSSFSSTASMAARSSAVMPAASMASLVIHASIRLPPQGFTMMPTGTSRLSARAVAKNQPTADVQAQDAAEARFHTASISSIGSWHRGVLMSMIRTLPAYVAALMMASRAPATSWKPKPETGISMLDWPAQIQTSPSMTSTKWMLSFPDLTVRT